MVPETGTQVGPVSVLTADHATPATRIEVAIYLFKISIIVTHTHHRTEYMFMYD